MSKNKISSSKKAFSLIEISIVILIIGILIGGVASGSRLIDKSKLSAAQNITRKSPVLEIDNLSGWWETVLSESIVTVEHGNSPKDGDKVSTWKDVNTQFSYKTNFSQSNSSNQPKYIRKGLNSLPTIFFDGSDKLNATPSVLFSGGNSFTVIVVKKMTIAGGKFLHNKSSGSSFGGYSLGYFSSGGQYFSYITSGGSSAAWNTFYYPTLKKFYIMVFTLNVSSGLQTVYSNGSLVASTTSLGYTPPNLSDSDVKFIIGCDNGSDYFNGEIAELIIYSRALDSDERIDIEKYLSKKWGIS